LIQRIGRTQAKRLNNIRVAAGICTRAKLRPHAKNGREKRSLEQLGPVIVDLILETGISAGVRTLLPFQHDRATVRHDQAGPHQ
jgi:hypothetical protein